LTNRNSRSTNVFAETISEPHNQRHSAIRTTPQPKDNTVPLTAPTLLNMTRDNPTTPLKIVIVGAGIGGIACAVECKKKGFDVVMYDQVKVKTPFPTLPSHKSDNVGFQALW
jgi:hypothetical protein